MAANFQVQFGSAPDSGTRSLLPRYLSWHCLPARDPAQPALPVLILLAQNPAEPSQITRYRAPTVRTSDRSCDTIGPRSQFTIRPSADGQRVTLEVREPAPAVAAAAPVPPAPAPLPATAPADPDALAWQRHRARLAPGGVRAATHGDDAARICRHLLAQRSSEVEAMRQRQPRSANSVQIERMRAYQLTQTIATLDMACRDQPEYGVREALLARLERSALACHALGGRGADCEPTAAW